MKSFIFRVVRSDFEECSKKLNFYSFRSTLNPSIWFVVINIWLWLISCDQHLFSSLAINERSKIKSIEKREQERFKSIEIEKRRWLDAQIECGFLHLNSLTRFFIIFDVQAIFVNQFHYFFNSLFYLFFQCAFIRYAANWTFVCLDQLKVKSHKNHRKCVALCTNSRKVDRTVEETSVEWEL